MNLDIAALRACRTTTSKFRASRKLDVITNLLCVRKQTGVYVLKDNNISYTEYSELLVVNLQKIGLVVDEVVTVTY